MTESPQIRAIVEPDLGYKFKMCLIRYFSFEAVFWNLISSAILSAILLLFVFDERMLDLYGFRLILITVGFTIFAFPLFLVIYSLKGKEKRVEYFFSDNGMSIIATDYEIICFWKYLKRVKENKNFFTINLLDGQVVLLPKVSFINLEDIVSVRELFRTSIGVEAYLKPKAQN